MLNNHPHISIVSPEYRGEKMVHELVARVQASVSSITENYEIILVNDASPDNTWSVIQQECAKDKRVKGLNLSRNFGQHYAITAGLAYATGDWVVVMDCDLQDVPEEIPALYAKAQEGFNIVMVRRVVKNVGWWKRMSSVWFHAVLDFLSGAKSDPTLSNFSIISSKVVAEINKVSQEARSYGALLELVGFPKAYVPIPQAARGEGRSSYTLGKLIAFAMNVIISSTNRPLRFAVGVGFAMSFVSFLLAIYNVIARLVGIIQMAGFTTTIFSIWFVGGLILFVLGILGLYIGKIFDQVKGRPLYVVNETLNIERK